MSDSFEHILSSLSALVTQKVDPQSVSDDLWPEVIEFALQQGLGPVLLWVVKQSSMITNSGPIWKPLVQSARYTALYQVALEDSQMRVNTALTNAGIPALWLKGFALAHTVYPLSRLRPMVDLDVLVPYEQKELALSVVQSLGYRLSSYGYYLLDKIDKLAQKMSHHYVLIKGINNAVTLDMHYRLLRESTTPLQSLSLFWKQTQINEAQNGEFLTLKPEAHLLYLIAHVILEHGEMDFYLLRYFDLHRLITKENLDWKVFVDQAIELRWTYAAQRALTLTAQFFDTAVPESVLRQLKDGRLTDEDIAHVIALQDIRSRPWEVMINRFATLSTSESVRFALEVLFPSPTYIRNRYDIGPERSVWPYYFYRWFSQSRKVLELVGNRLIRRIRKNVLV